MKTWFTFIFYVINNIVLSTTYCSQIKSCYKRWLKGYRHTNLNYLMIRNCALVCRYSLMLFYKNVNEQPQHWLLASQKASNSACNEYCVKQNTRTMLCWQTESGINPLLSVDFPQKQVVIFIQIFHNLQNFPYSWITEIISMSVSDTWLEMSCIVIVMKFWTVSVVWVMVSLSAGLGEKQQMKVISKIMPSRASVRLGGVWESFEPRFLALNS
jgi:hypothetical protein